MHIKGAGNGNIVRFSEDMNRKRMKCDKAAHVNGQWNCRRFIQDALEKLSNTPTAE